MLGTQTFFGKKDVFSQEKFDVNIPRYQDFEVLLRIHKRFGIYYLNDALVDYYLQNDSITKNSKSLLKVWEIIFDKDKDFLKTYSTYRKRLADDIIGEALNVENKDVQKKLFHLAFTFKLSFFNIIKYMLVKMNIYKFTKHFLIAYWRN